VALARALAPSPRILLMDEPFSSLDGRLRDHVRQETMDILRETSTTTVVVTHEPDEALRIADRIALLRERARWSRSAPRRSCMPGRRRAFAARFFSDVNELPGTYRDGRIETALGTFNAPTPSTMATGASASAPSTCGSRRARPVCRLAWCAPSFAARSITWS
jgi:iron(III) transport system ATP-binding protein